MPAKSTAHTEWNQPKGKKCDPVHRAERSGAGRLQGAVTSDMEKQSLGFTLTASVLVLVQYFLTVHPFFPSAMV